MQQGWSEEDFDIDLPCGCKLDVGPDAKVCGHRCHDTWRDFMGVSLADELAVAS